MRPDNKFRSTVLTAAMICGAATATHAATTFSDASAFASAGTVGVVETFDNDIAEAMMITFDSGITSMTTRPPSGASNRVRGGDFDGFAQARNFRDVIFDFQMPIFGFGADFDDQSINPDNDTDFSSLFVTGSFDGTEQSFDISEGFFGLTSSTSFQQVTFSSNAGAFLFGSTTPFGGEQFSVDNLTTLTALNDVAPVPLPAAGLLLLTGFGGLGGLRAMRRKMSA